MNLIEQQNVAKDLPMQYLQQAVNGQNPNLTPWIATAELQRRTTMNQHMQNAQGPQGPQPTVKDQVEQKAGLMATQAAQQAQAAQAQQSAAPPGPVPAGIPQPEPQPEEPVMAAHGGLMNAPISFRFAHGGILGYADGGETANTNIPETYVDDKGVRRFTATGEPATRSMADQPTQKPQLGLRAGVEQYATEPTQAASLPAAISEERGLAGEYGLDKPMGAEQRQAMEERRKAYDEYKGRAADRDFANYVAGLVGVPGSGGARYEQSRGQRYKDEAEFQREQIKDLSALEAAQRAAQEKRAGVAGASLGAAKTASAAERLGKAGIGERLVSVDAQTAAEQMRDLTSRYNADQQNKSQERIAALSRAMQGAQFNRQEARDAANQLNQMGQRAEADVNNLRAQYTAARKEMAQDEIDRIKPLLENAEAIQRSVVAAIGKSTGVAIPKETPKALSVADQQALNWANSNPKDPRAAQIKQKLGM
jgi:hypothetical protein